MEYPLNIYLTADNIISSLGFTTEENLNAVLSYRSGIKPDDTREIADTSILAARIDNEKLKSLAKEYKIETYSKLEQVIILSLKDIIKKSNINIQAKELGVVLATTKGNVEYLRNHTDNIKQRAYLWSTAKQIEEYFQLKNKVITISNACISGVSALVTARRMILNGDFKQVIVVGADVLSHFITSGFLSFQSISQKPCCPYDAKRDGLNLGEACGSILLSSEPTADAIILRGGSISNDANHISGPSRTGDGLALAINNAIKEAELNPSDIGTVNLHGTATVFNDEMESKAIHLAKLQHAPVNSFKSYFGHTLGAAGVIETIITSYQLKNNCVFGTLNYKEMGVPMPLELSAKHENRPLNHAVKTASGFGGCNAAIVLSKNPTDKKAENNELKYQEIRNCVIENSTITSNGKTVFTSEQKEFGLFIREAFKNRCETNMKFYKMDDLSKLAYMAAEYLLTDLSFSPTEIGIILGNSSASLDTDRRHQVLIDKDGDQAASPAVFVYTLPNVAMGEICIRHKIQGENTFFISEGFSSEEIKHQALIAMKKANLKFCIYGWCELLKENYMADFRLIEAL